MRKNRGFTLVELLVVIGIIALLISILMPTLSKARRSANTVKCLSNLRQVGVAFQLYAADFKGAIPVVRQDLPDNLTDTPPAPTTSTWWQDYVGPYISKAKFNTSNAADLNEARNSVIWGCVEWLGRNAVMNQYDTGYGMNGQFYATPDYPTGTTMPKKEFAMRWTQGSVYVGKYYRLGSIRYASERVLVGDSLLWHLNARLTAGGGATLPGQSMNPGTTHAGSVAVPGLMDYDLFRHSKMPPQNDGTYYKLSGATVATNAVYCDGHAETITSAEQAYRGIFLRAP